MIARRYGLDSERERSSPPIRGLADAIALLRDAGVAPAESAASRPQTPPSELIDQALAQARSLARPSRDPVRVIWHMPFSGTRDIAMAVAALPNVVLQDLSATSGLGGPHAFGVGSGRDLGDDVAAKVMQAGLAALHSHVLASGRRLVLCSNTCQPFAMACNVAPCAEPETIIPLGSEFRSIAVIRDPIEAYADWASSSTGSGGHELTTEAFAEYYTTWLRRAGTSPRFKSESFAVRPTETLDSIAAALDLSVDSRLRRQSGGTAPRPGVAAAAGMRRSTDSRDSLLQQARNCTALRTLSRELGYGLPVQQAREKPGAPEQGGAEPATGSDSVTTGFIGPHKPDATLGEVTRRSAPGGGEETRDTQQWIRMLPRLIANGETRMARKVTEYLRAEAFLQPRVHADALQVAQWGEQALLALESARVIPPTERGTVNLGVMRYRHPRREATSGNLGDAIQTIAALGHVLQHDHVTFRGDRALVDTLATIRRDIPDTRSRGACGPTVNLVVVDRDFSRANAVPEPTWLIANGWYMHEIHEGCYDFPFHPNVRPLLISVHMADSRLLTPAALDYLRKYGPVGCRDWATVGLLQSRRVPAFFSGCLTTTLDLLYDRKAHADGECIEVDAAVQGSRHGWKKATHWLPGGLRDLSLADLLQRADERLRRYAMAKQIVTGRLHCLLPAESIGVPVEFAPARSEDPRYLGLVGVEPPVMHRIRQGLKTKMQRMLSMMLASADETDVYRTWHELCASDVAHAQDMLACGSFRDARVPA